MEIDFPYKVLRNRFEDDFAVAAICYLLPVIKLKASL